MTLTIASLDWRFLVWGRPGSASGGVAPRPSSAKLALAPPSGRHILAAGLAHSGRM